MAKPLTDEQRQKIVSLRDTRTGREIAAMVGVSPALVSLVLNDKHRPSLVKSVEATVTKPAADLGLAGLCIGLVEAALETARTANRLWDAVKSHLDSRT